MKTNPFNKIVRQNVEKWEIINEIQSGFGVTGGNGPINVCCCHRLEKKSQNLEKSERVNK